MVAAYEAAKVEPRLVALNLVGPEDGTAALATDDQGVSRSSMTGEYLRAVTDQNLGYLDLKTLSRNSLEYSFLPGASLFTDFSSLTIAPACADGADTSGTTTPTSACATYLSANARAAAQWELERRYRVFASAY
jgi:adenosine deaminase